MASQHNIEFRVGVVILLAMLVLLVSIYWLQGYKLERNAQRIMIRFDDVGSLAVGDRVTVSGVHKGKVNGLELTNTGVLVELLVYRDVALKSDAHFTIRNMGVMGERFIAIAPGKSEIPLDLSKEIEGEYNTGLPEVMGMMGEMVGELREIVVSLKKTIASDSTLNKFNNTISNFESVSSRLSQYMTRNEKRLDQMTENFAMSSEQLNAAIHRNVVLADTTMRRFERSSRELESFTYQLDTLALSARRFADRLENNDGTLQAMIDDRTLYDDLRRAADDLDALIGDIRANPSKYINLKVELF